MDRTPLHKFMHRNRIENEVLANESGTSLRQIINVKLGHCEPTRTTMVAILWACSRLTGRRLRPSDLFDFSDPGDQKSNHVANRNKAA